MERDPSGMVDGPNLYAYVLNTPINASDPIGFAIRRDEREVPEAQAWHGAADSPWGKSAVKQWQALGSTDPLIWSYTQTKPNWNPRTRICSVDFLSNFDLTIQIRWMGAGTYAFSPARRFSTATGGSFLLRGIILPAGKVAEIRDHERQHAQIYEDYYNATYVWKEKEYQRFNDYHFKTVNASTCDRVVASLDTRIANDFIKRDARYGAIANQAHFALDRFYAILVDTGAGWATYQTGVAVNQVQWKTLPMFEYDPATGILKLSSLGL
jgi:hypothetical protein